MKQILTFLFLLCTIASHAQGVAIGTSSPTPDASAMLDVIANNKGILIPRLTTSERNSIASPATSLLIFNTDSTAFEFYTGSGWQKISGSGGAGFSLPFEETIASSPVPFRINNANTSGFTTGLYGYATGDGGRGVYGEAASATGATYGGEFRTLSTSGRAVYGDATATTGSTVGGYFTSSSSSGTGIQGIASATSGFAVGGAFSTSSPDGFGLIASHNAATGVFPGINGATASLSDSASGIRGRVVSTTPGAYSAGVRGINLGLGGNGIGVWGSQNGSGYGVFGTVEAGGSAIRGEGGGATGYAGYFVGRGFFSNAVGVGNNSPQFSLQVDHPTIYGNPAIGSVFGSNHFYMHTSTTAFGHSLIWNSGNFLRFGTETSIGTGYSEIARISSTGFGIGVAPNVSADVNGGLALRSATVTVSGSTQNITIGNRSYIKVSKTTSGTTFITLSSGLSNGQLLVLQREGGGAETGTISIDNPNTSNVALVGTIYSFANVTNGYYSLTLMWNGDTWVETARANSGKYIP